MRAASGDYLKGVGADEIKERGGTGFPKAFATFVQVLPEAMDAAREFDVPEGATAATVDVQLDPGETIRVSVEDPNGKPVSGFYAYGRQPRGIATRIQGATFDAVAFARDERRVLAIVDEAQKLGKIVVVSPKDLPDRRLTVRLEPMALVTGRLTPTATRSGAPTSAPTPSSPTCAAVSIAWARRWPTVTAGSSCTCRSATGSGSRSSARATRTRAKPSWSGSG